MANTNRYKALIQDICTQGHWTADEIHLHIKKKHPRSFVGIGTIYRNINELVNEGILMKHGGIGDKMVYESMKPPHGHLYCETSKQLIDIDISTLHRKDLPLPDTFCVDHIQIVISGSFPHDGTATSLCTLTGKTL